MDLLFDDATIVTMDGERRVIRGSVLIRDGEIVAVGDVEGRLGPNTTQRIDCSGKTIIPGLVQTHVHLCQTMFRGYADGLELLDWLRQRIWPLEAAHTPDSMRASAMLGMAELIRGGTTACLDMGSVRHTGEIFEAAEEVGFRLCGGKALMDSEGAPEGLREPTASALEESDALQRRWHGAAGGRLRYAWAPRFVLSCTEALLRQVAERAKSQGLLVHTHASESRHELEAVRERCGMDNVAYLHSLGLSGPNVAVAHCIWLSAEEERLMAENGTHLLHCPSSNLKLGSGIARVPELWELGVPISIGADGAPCNNNLDMWVEMRLAALIHLPRVGPLGLPPRDVFEMATIGGARALGIADRVGSIEVGKRADLVVLDLERPHATPAGEDVYARLVLAAHAADVETVVIDGEVVLDQGVLTVMDERRTLAEAGAHAERLFRNVS